MTQPTSPPEDEVLRTMLRTKPKPHAPAKESSERRKEEAGLHHVRQFCLSQILSLKLQRRPHRQVI
jgi:hypothetical protein